MAPLLKSLDTVTLFVRDPQRSKAFYRDVFGLPVHFEDQNSVVFKLENQLLNLLVISEAHGLIAPAPVAAGEAGSSFQFTIEVADADAVCEELGRRGVTLLNGPMNRPWGVRTAAFTDPDGHVWEVAQSLR